jgi:hypothetical protein
LRELRGIGLGAGREPDRPQRVEDASRDLTAWAAEYTKHERDVLEHRPPGQKLGVLEDDTDRSAKQGGFRRCQCRHRVAQHVDFAIRGGVVTVEEAQERRLARAAGTGQDHELPFGDAKRHVAQGRDIHRPDRIDLTHAVELDHAAARL